MTRGPRVVQEETETGRFEHYNQKRGVNMAMLLSFSILTYSMNSIDIEFCA